MKYRLTCIVFSVFLILSGISPALGASTGAHSANTTVATPGDEPGVDPTLPARGMPGWPVPDKPIPYHKPGHPSKAGSYNTQVTRMSAQGTEKTVALTGLDALMADGVMNDPLQGNYRLVDLDKILVHEGTQIRSFSALSGTVSDPVEVIPGSERTFTGDVQGVAAGDLNGDGQDEQISAWVDSGDNLKLSIGEMPGSLGKATSAPAAVAHSDGKMDLLVRGYDQSLWHRHYDGSTWGGWDNAGGLLISGPAIASRGDGTFDAFAIGTDNLIYRRHWDGSGWSGDWVMVDDAGYWVQASAMPGPAVPMPADVDAPGAAAHGTAQLDLFRRAPDNTLRWRHSDDGSSWGNWQNLGGIITSAPSAVSTGADHLQVFARGVDGALWHRTYSGGSWGGWARLEKPTDVRIASAPTAVSPRGSDRINVYVRGSSDRLWRIQSVGGSWGSWQVEDEGSKSTTGMFGGALQFDGSDDYVAADSVVDDLDAGSVSFGGWVRPETNSGEKEALFGFHTASGDNLDILFYLPDSDEFSFYSPQAYESSTHTFAPDLWHHVIVVLDNAGNGTLYVDCHEENSFTTNYRPASDGRFSIGQEWDGTATSDFFAGRIDEVFVFDRVLSATEIQIVCDADWDKMDDKVLGLHMDETEATHGTTLEDASGLGNHGTLYTYAPLASGVGAAAWGDAVDLFALGYDGSLLHNRFDGSAWADWGNWGGLPPCCQTSDTGIDSPYDLDITTGHFTGDGRAQIVVAASDRENVDIRIFDVVDGFGLLERAQFTLGREDGEGWERVKIAAGDFDSGLQLGDGVDELAVLVDEDDPWPTTWDRYRVQLFDVAIGVDGAWEIAAKGKVDWGIEGEGDDAYSRAFSSMDMTTGDFNADGNDEIFVAALSKDFDRREDPPEFKTTHTWYRHVIEPDDLSQPVSHEASGDWYTGDWLTEQVPELGGVQVGAGNLDGNPDNGDEIVAQWARTKRDSTTYLSFRGLRVYSVDPVSWTLSYRADPYDYCIGCSVDGLEDKSGALAVGDFDRDLQDEIAVSYAWLTGTDAYHKLRVFSLDCPSDSYTITLQGQYQAATTLSGYRGLAAGSFTGESLRVGAPTYRLQHSTGDIIAIINAPPKHKDILDGVTYDINSTDTGTYAAYENEQGQSTTMSIQVQRDWGFAGGMEMCIGDPQGTHVKTSLDATYDEHFENTTTAFTQIVFGSEVKASSDDVVYYTGKDLQVWEYPVYEDNSGTPTGRIMVVFPLPGISNTGTHEFWENGNTTCDFWYAPEHQINNVWSYAGNDTQLKDLDPAEGILNTLQTVTVGPSDGEFWTCWTDSSVKLRASAINQGVDSLFEMQIGGDSFQVSAQPFGIGVSYEVHLPSVKGTLKNSYSEGTLSTHTVAGSDATTIRTHFNSIDPSGIYNYEVTPYLYWAKDGYLVLDYLTNPTNTSFWNFYNKPDPAFILPWRDGHCTGKEQFSKDIVASPPFATNGETVAITATVHNFSNVRVEDVTVRFFQGEPGQNVQIGPDRIIALAARGKVDVSVPWTADGTGEQRIYAVIDPDHTKLEIHDETTNPENDNNVAFGVVAMGDSGFVDPGAQVYFDYQFLTYTSTQGIVTNVFIPTAATTETVRFEMTPLTITQHGFRLAAYQGGSDRDQPWNLTFDPAPAAILFRYSDENIAGLDENTLMLYYDNDGTWEDAACGEYQRDPEANWILVPICRTGDFALLEKGPAVYLPLILKSSK